MDFLLGVLFAVAFFVLLLAAYQLGQRSKQKDSELVLNDEFELVEQRRKAKKLHEDFQQLMTYNEAKARKG
jgi:hypothetical protein